MNKYLFWFNVRVFCKHLFLAEMILKECYEHIFQFLHLNHVLIFIISMGLCFRRLEILYLTTLTHAISLTRTGHLKIISFQTF